MEEGEQAETLRKKTNTHLGLGVVTVEGKFILCIVLANLPVRIESIQQLDEEGAIVEGQVMKDNFGPYVLRVVRDGEPASQTNYSFIE